ncbi:hypothetical protein BC936DRAFT_146042 [Jimgerdemannia flammicorona]|nr:hypothetical protein BC936DRAFT_146042 [Jimgerdemannia flammicorona]
MKGLDISLVKTMANLLTSVGLTDVEADYVSCPFGWGGRVGQLCMKVLELGYGSLRSNLAPIMGISDTEYDKLVDGLEPQFRVRRSWTKVHYAFGMKPFK